MSRTRYRNPQLLGQLAALGCVICHGEAQVHHSRQGMGTGQRSGDHRAYPLCRECHQDGPEAIHRLGWREWGRRFGAEDEHIRRCHRLLGFVVPEGDWR